MKRLQMGHEVFTAYNGPEGIKRAREIRPDVIFCDIGLPGKNGYEVARIVREDSALKTVFLVALIGYAGENDVKAAKRNGYNHHLAKPIDLKEIEGILAEASGNMGNAT